jgi:hypothetical protein
MREIGYGRVGQNIPVRVEMVQLQNFRGFDQDKIRSVPHQPFCGVSVQLQGS